jgi:succinate dehydrogenase hydrophobic anchor subunit
VIIFSNIKHDKLFLIVIVSGLVLKFVAFGLLYFTVPDPQVFNSKVENLFVENEFTKYSEIKLLEVIAQSGSLFENSVALYSKIILHYFL